MTRASLSCLLLSILTSVPVSGADRVALVIGNEAYQHGRRLNTAKEDAEAVAARLKNPLGFDVVLRTDAELDDFPEAITEFLGPYVPPGSLRSRTPLRSSDRIGQESCNTKQYGRN